MLVLTRKLNEEIVIGDDIKITLVKVKGGSVRLGIQAPRDVKVLRGEISRDDETTASEAIEVDPLAEVFADPEAVRAASQAPALLRNVMKADTDSRDAKVIVGKLKRTAKTAPLARFVAAS